MSASPTDPAAPVRANYPLIAGGVLLLAALTLAVHGWSLADGLVLDDHWHFRQYQEAGWSLRDLLDTTTIDTRNFIALWWQERPVIWQYSRPLAVLVAKFTTWVSGGQPAALHAVSLGLHWLSALLVWRLATGFTAQVGWSFIAALVFLIYPHAVFTVHWLAAQNVVLATALSLMAVLAWRRAGGPVPVAGPQIGTSTPLARGWYALALLAWLLALLTRENALLLPIFLVGLDLAGGGSARVRARWAAYAPFAFIGLAFAVWRALAYYHPLPDVYVRRPAGDWGEYLPWLAAKLLHYLVSCVWPSPLMIGPSGRFNPWREAPLDCLLLLGLALGLGGIYYIANRRQRGWWLWPLWIVLCVLPVLPVMATPHTGYPGGVAFALGVVLWPAALARRGALRGTRCGVLVGAFALLFLAMSLLTMFNRWQWTGLQAAERLTPARIAAAPPAPAVQDIYLINLPFVSIYTQLHLERQLAPPRRDRRVHALTFSADPVMIEHPCVIEQLDAHRFTVRTAGPPFFSRLLGRFLIDAFRPSGPLSPGETIDAGAFRARVLEADWTGVRLLEFIFVRPLHDPAHCFYVATRSSEATPVRFLREVPTSRFDALTGPPTTEDAVRLAGAHVEQGVARAADALLAAVQNGDGRLAQLAETAFLNVAGYVAEVTAAPTQAALSAATRGPTEWAAIARWWRTCVNDEVLAETWLQRDRFADLIKLREEVPHARMWASRVIRTDLYLTGPPFPARRVTLPTESAPASRSHP